jgi:hypothetical protein
MRLFQQLFGGIALLFGLYYLQLIFFEYAARWNLFVPFFDALPFEILIYLLVTLLFLLSAIIYLSDEDHPVYALLFLLQAPWLLFFPLQFVPSIPFLLYYLNAKKHHQPVQHPLLYLAVGYLIHSIAPVFGSLVLFLLWGRVSTAIFSTKKRSA